MKRRNLFSLLFIAATLGLMIALAFSNRDLTNAWDALLTLDMRWVLGALCAIAANVAFDTLCLYFFLHRQKYKVSLRVAGYVSLTGFYYSNITPGASGGQPMQVYHMSKHGVPVPIGTSAISIKFFAQQVAVVAMSSALWFLNRVFVDVQLAGVRWAIYIGYALNFASIPLILLVALHRPLVQAVITFVIRLLARLKLVKHPQESILRVNAGMDVYHASILRIAKHPGQLIGMLGLAALSTLGLMAVPLFVYRAFGMQGAPWGQLLTASFLLFISASYTPLPGASGAQEGGFLLFFGSFFTKGVVGLAILVWRFFTFYLFLLIGAAMSIVNNLRENRRRARMEKAGEGAAVDPSAAAQEADPAQGPADATAEANPAAPAPGAAAETGA